MFVIGLLVAISFSLIVVMFRASMFELLAMITSEPGKDTAAPVTLYAPLLQTLQTAAGRVFLEESVGKVYI